MVVVVVGGDVCGVHTRRRRFSPSTSLVGFVDWKTRRNKGAAVLLLLALVRGHNIFARGADTGRERRPEDGHD